MNAWAGVLDSLGSGGPLAVHANVRIVKNNILEIAYYYLSIILKLKVLPSLLYQCTEFYSRNSPENIGL